MYLLDRGQAPPAKVRAFLRAIAIIDELGPAETERRVREHTLSDLEGIGPSTGGVITDAVLGRPSEYIRDLEARTAIPVGEGARFREALKGDCHVHSEWSDGGASIERMARAAMDLGHEYLAMTDHSARLTVAHGLDEQRLRRQLGDIAALNSELAPFRILTGLEVDILEDGTLDLADEVLADLDIVVASVHSKLRMPAEQMTRRMVRAVAHPHTDVLGHCTGRRLTGRGRPQSDFDADVVFAACARFDKAVEINCRPERQDPPEELLGTALRWGCKLVINTDAHAPGQLEWLSSGCDKAAGCAVPLESVVNSWGAEDLLRWTNSHPEP
ncbi:MAG: phosphatase YcdX [Acidimicrobiales bacterium]|nr:phosphatase YcdX [Acidimicrobiales bacterium]